MRELSVAEQRYQAVMAVIGDGTGHGGLSAATPALAVLG
jgi:hypothetical protein